ncbi:MAG TPA: hypothetical protein VHL34_22490 [Rhizomicrobium sp.]|jgi:hypothetical protein|nr:hypothetical protein [Rhizomicrobium sp.]
MKSVVLGVALSVVITPLFAASDLNGKYYLAGSSNCVSSSAGFNANFVSNQPPGSISGTGAGAINGTAVFNSAKGTVQFEETTMNTGTAFLAGTGQFFVASGQDSRITYKFTTEVDASGNKTLTLKPKGDATGKITFGSTAGDTITRTGMPNLKGLVTADGSIAIVGTGTIVIETTKSANTGNTSSAICNRSYQLYPAL